MRKSTRKPVPALCLVAMLFKVAKMSKSQKPEGFTPFAIVSFGYPKESGNERLKEDRYDPSRVHYL